MRTAPPKLLPIFRSEMQLELLGLVLLQPERTWTLDDLTKALAAPISSVHREVRRAVDAGLVTRDTRQRPHLLQAASDSAAYDPLRQLLELTVGLRERLTAALSSAEGVRAAAIHGSWAQGRVGAQSDVDVIVVTEGDRKALQRTLRRIGRMVGRQVDASILTGDDYASLLDDHNPFLEGILRGPRVDLVGDLDALAVA